MPNPPLTGHTFHRLVRMARRLAIFIEPLDGLDLRHPLPRSLAGPGRRLTREAAAFLQRLSGAEAPSLPPENLPPAAALADLCVRQLVFANALIRHAKTAAIREGVETYPRGSGAD